VVRPGSGKLLPVIYRRFEKRTVGHRLLSKLLIFDTGRDRLAMSLGCRLVPKSLGLVEICLRLFRITLT
jgi:hypothetical protein